MTHDTFDVERLHLSLQLNTEVRMMYPPSQPLALGYVARISLFRCAHRRSRRSLEVNPVVHFEMPAEDRKRVADFYTKVFGWKTQQMGEEMGNYVLATTTETDEKGYPKQPGRINGGFFQKTDDLPAQYPSVVIAVEDIEEHMKKVQEAGGKVLGEPWDIPGVGLYVSFIDTGNRVGMIQPRM